MCQGHGQAPRWTCGRGNSSLSIAHGAALTRVVIRNQVHVARAGCAAQHAGGGPASQQGAIPRKVKHITMPSITSADAGAFLQPMPT